MWVQFPQHFYTFDILGLNGRDRRLLPPIERERILGRMVPTKPASILYADRCEERGADLFRVVCEMDREGIVAKHRDPPYGLENAWLGIKNPRYSQVERREPRSLVLKLSCTGASV